MSTDGNRWIALLRGVNVGGVTVKSAPLAELFRELGYTEVTTVLASGNVLFSAPDASPAELKTTIEAGLKQTFGYDAWIVLTNQASLAPIVDAYPFDEVDEKQPYVMFSSAQASLDALLEFAASGLDSAVDRVTAGDGVLYWEVTRGMSTDSAFSKESSKARFKSSTTTRNLRTLRKLL